MTAQVTDTVQVGPFTVADLGRADLVGEVIRSSVDNFGVRPTRAFALHVSGLNSRHDLRFVGAMRNAEIVYADGGSVVLIGRLSGARQLQRAATTDIGWEVLAGLSGQLGRPARMALIGGPEGLALAAGLVLAEAGHGELVLAEHGYHQDWTGVLTRLHAATPDIVIVGLGVPTEMTWVDEHFDQLPAVLVLTCGGWFGHLLGDEKRAPDILRHAGLEWIARFAQSPLRLGPRYAQGLLSTAILSIRALAR